MKIRAWGLPFALTLLAAFASDSWGESKQPSPSKQTTQPPATDQRGTDQVPLAVKILPAQDAKEQADKADKGRKEKAIIDEKSAFETQRIADYTSRLAWFTLMLFGAAVLQAGLFLWQLRYMRKGMDDATIAAHAAKESADTAKLQAEVARGTLKTMQDTAERQLRAHVGVESGHLALSMDGAKIKPRVTIRVKNFGQTPAYKVRCKGAIAYAVEFSDALNDRLISMSGQNTIFPQHDQRIIFSQDFNDAPEEDLPRIFVFGSIAYEDVFGHFQRTGFRFTAAFIDPFVMPGPIHADLAPCEDGNEAT